MDRDGANARPAVGLGANPGASAHPPVMRREVVRRQPAAAVVEGAAVGEAAGGAVPGVVEDVVIDVVVDVEGVVVDVDDVVVEVVVVDDVVVVGARLVVVRTTGRVVVGAGVRT
jgi:hypothetical protein